MVVGGRRIQNKGPPLSLVGFTKDRSECNGNSHQLTTLKSSGSSLNYSHKQIPVMMVCEYGSQSIFSTLLVSIFLAARVGRSKYAVRHSDFYFRQLPVYFGQVASKLADSLQLPRILPIMTADWPLAEILHHNLTAVLSSCFLHSMKNKCLIAALALKHHQRRQQPVPMSLAWPPPYRSSIRRAVAAANVLLL